MRNSGRYSTIRFWTVLILLTGSLLSGISANAQCEPNFYTYRIAPGGELCSAQYITLETYYGNPDYDDGVFFSGLIRWYDSETGGTLLRTGYVNTNYGATSSYSFYGYNGATVWVSYYDYLTNCESYRVPYIVTVGSIPPVNQVYTRSCGRGTAQIQVSSNPGVVFQLYKYVVPDIYTWNSNQQ
jgi:hypothetical protein